MGQICVDKMQVLELKILARQILADFEPAVNEKSQWYVTKLQFFNFFDS